jgi:uncharacterized RDD family membrane protein YckC
LLPDGVGGATNEEHLPGATHGTGTIIEGGNTHMAYQQPPSPAYAAPTEYAQPTYANWLYRVASTLIDGLVASVPVIVGYIIALAISAGDPSGGMSGPAMAILGVTYVISLGISIWNLFIRQGRTGQSLGKQAVGTRLVSLQTGQPIGALMAFLRQICHFLDSIACYIGYLWPLWDAKRQTFADKIVGTVVVRA